MTKRQDRKAAISSLNRTISALRRTKNGLEVTIARLKRDISKLREEKRFLGVDVTWVTVEEKLPHRTAWCFISMKNEDAVDTVDMAFFNAETKRFQRENRPYSKYVQGVTAWAEPIKPYIGEVYNVDSRRVG